MTGYVVCYFRGSGITGWDYSGKVAVWSPSSDIFFKRSDAEIVLAGERLKSGPDGLKHRILKIEVPKERRAAPAGGK